MTVEEMYQELINQLVEDSDTNYDDSCMFDVDIDYTTQSWDIWTDWVQFLNCHTNTWFSPSPLPYYDC